MFSITRKTELVTPLTAGRKLSAITAILTVPGCVLGCPEVATGDVVRLLTDGCDELICLDIDNSQHF